MTRINTEAPGDLLDQHLLAEYRELPRVFTLAERWLEAGKPGKLPPTYRLGTGHVRYFYDKTKWLARRQQALVAECLRRGFAIQHIDTPVPVPGLDGDWTPRPEDRLANLARLSEKYLARPDFYRYWVIKVRTNPYTPMVEAILNRMDRS